MTEITYKFKEPLAEGQDPASATILEIGHVAETTFFDLLDIIDSNNKIAREAKKQIEIDEATIANLIHNHPFVQELTGVQIVAAKMYEECTGRLAKYKAKLEEVEKVQPKNLELKEKIIAQIPELANAKSPEEIKAEHAAQIKEEKDEQNNQAKDSQGATGGQAE